MEPVNPYATKSKENVIKDALKQADQVASLTATKVEDIIVPRTRGSEKATSKTSDENETKTTSKPNNKTKKPSNIDKKLVHSHQKKDHEIFESLKNLEDKIVMSFAKIFDLVSKKHFNMVSFLKDEIFHHLDHHHSKINHHIDHKDTK